MPWETVRIRESLSSGYSRERLLAVEGVHGVLHACKDEGTDQIGPHFKTFGQGLQFFRIPFPQHIVDLFALAKIRPHPKSEAVVLGGLKDLLNILQSIVSPIAALGLEPDGPKGEVDVIGDHQ